MKPIFESEEEAIKWVGLNIPWAVKPKKKTDSIKFINPFTSTHAHDVVVQALGKHLFKLQQKQHLIDMMNTPLGQEVGHSVQVEETLEEVVVNKFGLVDPILGKSDYRIGFESGLIQGAKWQQERMYSEEEVLKLLINFSDDRTFLKEDVAIQWFEQFKKQ